MKLNNTETPISVRAIPAGEFLNWLRHTGRAQITNEGSSVPCGECVACCTSSYFIHIQPGETDTLAKIPKELLFPAPGLPRGNVLLGYNEKGHCPMFTDGRCSIYENRPQTCRSYDCRIFPATGLSAGESKPAIERQSRRWKFEFPSSEDSTHLAAVKSAAKFLTEHTASFPDGFVPGNPTQQAVLAIKIYPVFLNLLRENSKAQQMQSKHQIAAAVIEFLKKFESGEIEI